MEIQETGSWWKKQNHRISRHAKRRNTPARRMKTLCVEENIIWWERRAARIDCCCSRLAGIAYRALGRPNCLTDVEVLFVTLLWRRRTEENQIHVFELKINSVDFKIPIGSKSNSLYTHPIPLNLKSGSESIEEKQDVNFFRSPWWIPSTNKDWAIDNLKKEHINQVCYLGLSRSMKT